MGPIVFYPKIRKIIGAVFEKRPKKAKEHFFGHLKIFFTSGRFRGSNTSMFSKSILPLEEQRYAILVRLDIGKAVQDYIISLLINDLYNHRNE